MCRSRLFCWFDSHDFLSQESACGEIEQNLLHGGVEKENRGKSTRKNHEGPLTCHAVPSIWLRNTSRIRTGYPCRLRRKLQHSVAGWDRIPSATIRTVRIR
ncbi:hypothetical protein GQ607_015194 [Colletotrichum asianum]|uniref:Uncharacterized protein n=1 Tax=Colletotrichum asianum TaxID=702518 RepID=A0A8H3ZFU6_9PEZI|nr:hypothetical protein GQ607_015194 [Colletotrichum asianum]